jgi:hypothetical protein
VTIIAPQSTALQSISAVPIALDAKKGSSSSTASKWNQDFCSFLSKSVVAQFRRRFLESSEVQYIMTLETSCKHELAITGKWFYRDTICDDAEADLYKSVTAQLTSSVDMGAFASDLQTNASTNAKAASLANVFVQPPSFKMRSESSQSPTQTAVPDPPTLRPTSALTSQSSQALPASSGGVISTHAIYLSSVLLWYS